MIVISVLSFHPNASNDRAVLNLLKNQSIRRNKFLIRNQFIMRNRFPTIAIHFIKGINSFDKGKNTQMNGIASL